MFIRMNNQEMNYSKRELEKLISKKKTLGKYIFNKKLKIFTSDVEVALGIRKVSESLYKASYYFFDGYEVSVEDSQLFFEGTPNQALQKAIDSWNESPEIFMGYPIIYTNINCVIDDDN